MRRHGLVLALAERRNEGAGRNATATTSMTATTLFTAGRSGEKLIRDRAVTSWTTANRPRTNVGV